MEDYDVNKKITKRAAKKLTKLADFLEHDVPSKQFNLQEWVSGSGGVNDCGTIACACGWAAISPKFRGLTTKEMQFGGINIICTGTGAEGIEAVVDYFHITEAQGDYLFLDYNYPNTGGGRMAVVKRIRKFVKDKQIKGTGKYARSALRYYDE